MLLFRIAKREWIEMSDIAEELMVEVAAMNYSYDNYHIFSRSMMTKLGFLLNGWVEEGSNSYQHWCKEGADGYDGTESTYGGEGSGSPIAVSYIANKHKISIEVLVDGNVVDSGSSFWWPDDITNPSNPLYAEGGFVVRVRNNGNSRKNVSSSCSCFSVCVQSSLLNCYHDK